MAERQGAPRRSREDERAMAAVDSIDDRPHVVIADVAADEAWIAISEPDAMSLEEWR